MSAPAGAFAIALALCALVLAVWSLSVHYLGDPSPSSLKRLVLRRPTPVEHIDLCGRVTELERKVPDDLPAVELGVDGVVEIDAHALTLYQLAALAETCIANLLLDRRPSRLSWILQDALEAVIRAKEEALLERDTQDTPKGGAS